ncbi:MAG: hypothetical protein JWO19_182 [Bryobacterales bacterium]|nr:hypothetical protein [Bryobacterales bacterium]
MKRFSLSRLGALATLGLIAFNPAVKADEWNRKTVISISQPLEVPGVVLPPGTYVMKLMNSSSNRHIVQVMNERENQQLALTLTAAAERLRPTDKTVLTMYEGSKGAPPALRTWYYPGDTVGQEFLYPHKQAVSISERTNVAVREVETGKPVVSTTESNESRTDTLIARAEPAPAPRPEPVPEPAAAPEPQQPAAEPQPPSVNSSQTNSLPQTSGNGPLAALIGGLSFVLAFGVRKLKRSRIN